MFAVSALTPAAQAFSTSDAVYGEVKAFLGSPEARELDHRALEQQIGAMGRKLMCSLFQDQLDQRSGDELETYPMTAGGFSLTHRRPNERRQLMTLFGPVTVARIGYSSRANGTVHPLDAELNLPRNLHSSGVIERVATASARGSFEQAANVLEEHGGGHVAKRQVREIALHAAQDFESFYAQREVSAADKPKSPAMDSASKLMVLSTDGKGVVMRKQSLRDSTRQKAEASKPNRRDKRLRSGEKRQCKRMAQVAAVYDLAPWERSPSDVTKALRPVQGTASKRPIPGGKRVWASVKHDAKRVIGDMFDEALRRDPQKRRTWVALVDGNISQLRALDAEATAHQLSLTTILDIIHVVEYLWKAVGCFRTPSSQDAEDWVTERFLSILDGNVSQVAAGIRRSATRQGLSASERSAADICCDYLLRHKEYMRYDAYLAAGYPVGTGVIEGACRYLVKDRMDLTGARWGLDGAEAVLQLRAMHASGDLESYWEYHSKMELKRNHAARFYDGHIPALRPKKTKSAKTPYLELVR
jgi:hypothetical protein